MIESFINTQNLVKVLFEAIVNKGKKMDGNVFVEFENLEIIVSVVFCDYSNQSQSKLSNVYLNIHFLEIIVFLPIHKQSSCCFCLINLHLLLFLFLQNLNISRCAKVRYLYLDWIHSTVPFFNQSSHLLFVLYIMIRKMKENILMLYISMAFVVSVQLLQSSKNLDGDNLDFSFA